jgi:hypothetical protein
MKAFKLIGEDRQLIRLEAADFENSSKRFYVHKKHPCLGVRAF